MEIFDNVNKIVKTDLERTITEGSRVSIAAACFSIHAYHALKEQLDGIDELRFIFTSPAFVAEKPSKEKREFYIPRLSRERGLYGTEFEVKLRNELTQKAIARECAEWIRKKAKFRSNVTSGDMDSLLDVACGGDGFSYTPMDGFTTSELGLERGNHIARSVIKFQHSESRQLIESFEKIWSDKSLLEDVTGEVLESITVAYRENPPDFLYFVALYNIFSEFLEDLSEDVLPNEATGFKKSAIWNMLYSFQKDAALAIINKLEKYNGCILADSVGLGKTFTALAVIKYYETRNRSTLVLCPKKLSDNWCTFKENYVNNPVAKDRLNYAVLHHTDLSRTRGVSNGVRLDQLNWGTYDLVVIDESHNFRNGGDVYGEDERENRYLRLLNKVIKAGVKTKVLMLSATPVNNRFIDLRNQLRLAYEGDSSDIDGKLGTSKPMDEVFRNAQRAFNEWYRSNSPVPRRVIEAERNRRPRLCLKDEMGISLKIPERYVKKASPVLTIDNGIKRQIRIETVSVAARYRTYLKTIDLAKCQVSPFEGFRVELDGEKIYENSPCILKMFKGDGDEIKKLARGMNYLYAAPGFKPVSESRISNEQGDLYYAHLNLGDSVRVGDEEYRVLPSSVSKNEVVLRIVPGATAYDQDGREIAVSKEGVFSVSLTGNGKMSYVIVGISKRGDAKRHEKRLLTGCELPDCEGSYFFSVAGALNGPGEYRVDVESDSGKSLCDAVFLHLPQYRVTFDTQKGLEFYYKKPRGRAEFKIAKPPSQEFDTSIEKIGWEVPVDGENYPIKTDVPVLKVSFFKDEWLTPGRYDKTVGNFQIGSHIRLMPPPSLTLNADDIGLFINDRELELDSAHGGVFEFNVGNLANEMDKRPNSRYVLKARIGDRDPLDLTEIITCNQYDPPSFEDGSLTITMGQMIDGSESRCLVEIDGFDEKTREIALRPGANDLGRIDEDWFSIRIQESKPNMHGDGWRDVYSWSKNGKTAWYEITETGCVLRYKNHRLELSKKIDFTNKTDLCTDYEFYGDRDPWTRKEVRHELICIVIPKIVSDAKGRAGLGSATVATVPHMTVSHAKERTASAFKTKRKIETQRAVTTPPPVVKNNSTHVAPYGCRPRDDEKPVSRKSAGPRLITGDEALQSGNSPMGLDFEVDGEEMHYDWDEIVDLVSIDEGYDPNRVEHNRERMKSKGPLFKQYVPVCNLVKEAILRDSDAYRLWRRILRFRNIDIDFAIQLCNRRLEVNRDDSGTKYQLACLMIKKRGKQDARDR